MHNDFLTRYSCAVRRLWHRCRLSVVRNGYIVAIFKKITQIISYAS